MGSISVGIDQGSIIVVLTVTNSILPIIGTIAGTLLGAFSTYFYQKKTEEKKNMLEKERRKEYASVILQISTKELNSYKAILAKIKGAGSDGSKDVSTVFYDGEYVIESDAELNKVQDEIKKATNLFSKLPLESRTSIFLVYLNSVDSAYSAYEHFSNFNLDDKYGYKGVYSHDELVTTINKIDIALKEIEELMRIHAGK